jgi:ParB-like chromosome segregation protein Spo0J
VSNVEKYAGEPISRIEWLPVEMLQANGYNPNVVLKTELELLEFSVLKTGWIQPILVSRDYVIIDGFHRWHLSLKSARLREKYRGEVPCCVLDVDLPEAMLMTVRINRAKGSHVAVRMHELVKQLVDDHAYDAQRIAQGIGAHKGEVELLYSEGVFAAKKTPDHKYSKAWKPRTA